MHSAPVICPEILHSFPHVSMPLSCPPLLSPGKGSVAYKSGLFCVSRTAATGMPKFETGPQKSVFRYMLVVPKASTNAWRGVPPSSPSLSHKFRDGAVSQAPRSSRRIKCCAMAQCITTVSRRSTRSNSSISLPSVDSSRWDRRGAHADGAQWYVRVEQT